MGIKLFGKKKKNAKLKTRLPGFALTLGLSMTYMTLLIFIPLSALILYAAHMSFGVLASDR